VEAGGQDFGKIMPGLDHPVSESTYEFVLKYVGLCLITSNYRSVERCSASMSWLVLVMKGLFGTAQPLFQS
jgi:hypothetical protein